MEKELEKLVNSRRSVIISGNTCANKTDSVCFPILDKLIEKEESLFILDVKNEYYNNFKDVLSDKKYNIIKIDFKDPYYGDAWNPYSLVYDLYQDGKKDEALSMLEFIHSNIFYTSDAVDPFWDMSAANIASAAALILIKYYDKDYLNINNIGNIVSSIDSMNDTLFFNKYLNDDEIMGYAKQVLFAPTETKGGILAVARQKLRLYASRDALSNLMSTTSFNMNKLDKTVVFVNIPNQTTYVSRLVITLLSQILECNKDNKINYILDNFDYLSYEKFIGSLLNNNDSNNRFYIVTRSVNRLKDISREYLDTLATIVRVKESVLEINYSDEDIVVVDKVINNINSKKIDISLRDKGIVPKILDISKEV